MRQETSCSDCTIESVTFFEQSANSLAQYYHTLTYHFTIPPPLGNDEKATRYPTYTVLDDAEHEHDIAEANDDEDIA